MEIERSYSDQEGSRCGHTSDAPEEEKAWEIRISARGFLSKIGLAYSLPRLKFLQQQLMQSDIPRAARHYGIALINVVLATVLTVFLHKATGEEALFFLVAVTISTLYGGLGPGLLCIGLSVLSINYFFVGSVERTVAALYNIPLVIVFACAALLISYLVETKRRAEVRLRAANKDLERRVAERTSELVQSNRVKDQFLALVSHELRQPLTSILGWLTVLEGRVADEALVARALRVIKTSALHQTHLVSELVDLASIARGSLSQHFEPVDFASILNAAVEEVLPKAGAQGVAIEVMTENTAALVRGDYHGLLQVILNLLENALKFTPPGGRIEVRLCTATEELKLSVSDTGKGISREFMPHVFEPFRRASDNATETGLGLGLAIVKHVIESHGGRVSAESQGEGKGSEFIVTLPLKGEPIAKPILQAASAMASSAGAGQKAPTAPFR